MPSDGLGDMKDVEIDCSTCEMCRDVIPGLLSTILWSYAVRWWAYLPAAAVLRHGGNTQLQHVGEAGNVPSQPWTCRGDASVKKKLTNIHDLSRII